MKASLMLNRLRIFDDDGTLSFTSIYLYLCAVLCLISPLDLYSLAFAALTLLNANLKRLSRHHAATRDQRLNAEREAKLVRDSNNHEALTIRVHELEVEVQKLVQVSNISRLGR